MENYYDKKPVETHDSGSDDDFVNRGDVEDRLGFIRKVYGILSMQLCLTAGAITAVKTVPGWNEGINTPAMGGLAMGLLIVSIAIECAIFCCKSVARKTPTNYICLFVFTICQAFVFAFICA